MSEDANPLARHFSLINFSRSDCSTNASSADTLHLHANSTSNYVAIHLCSYFTLDGHALHARHEFRYMAYCAPLRAKRVATHAAAAAVAAKQAARAWAISSSSTSSSSYINNEVKHALHGHGLRARHEFRYMPCLGPPCAKCMAIHTVAAAIVANATAVGTVCGSTGIGCSSSRFGSGVVTPATKIIETTVPGIGVHISAPCRRKETQGGQFWPPNPGHRFGGFPRM